MDREIVDGIEFVIKKKEEKYYIRTAELFKYLGFNIPMFIEKFKEELNKYNNLNNEKIEIRLTKDKKNMELEKKYSNFCKCGKITFDAKNVNTAVSYEFLNIILNSENFSEETKKTIIKLKNKIEEKYSKEEIDIKNKTTKQDQVVNKEKLSEKIIEEKQDETTNEKIAIECDSIEINNDGKPFVYIFIDDKDWVYVGRSDGGIDRKDKRIKEHISRGKDKRLSYKTYDSIKKIKVIYLDTKEQAKNLENHLISNNKELLKYNKKDEEYDKEDGENQARKLVHAIDYDFNKIKKHPQFEKSIKPMKEQIEIIRNNKELNSQENVAKLIKLFDLFYNTKW